MAVDGVSAGGLFDGLLATHARGYVAQASSGEATGRRAAHAPIRGVAPSNYDPLSPAGLLAALIDRMGGAVGSRTKGAYINLRI